MKTHILDFGAALASTKVLKVNTNSVNAFSAEVNDGYGHYILSLTRSRNQVKQHMTKIAGVDIPSAVNRWFSLDFYKWDQEHLINAIERSIATKINCLN